MWSGWKTVMAGPRPLVCVSLLSLTLIAAAGCAGAPPAREEKPPAATAEKKPTAPPPAVPTVPAEKKAVVSPSKYEEITSESSRDDVDVIDPGGDRKPVSLVDASRAEQERRARSGPPIAVINDKNVAHSTGRITISESKKPGVTPQDSSALQALKDEKYWRERALDVRTRLRKSMDRVEELETTAAGLRRRFYAEEDPHLRDSKIKPEWDRSLAQLEETRNDIETTRQELEELLDEGRRAGALPGWLREGGELIPDEKTESGPGIVDPMEPDIYEEKPPR